MVFLIVGAIALFFAILLVVIFILVKFSFNQDKNYSELQTQYDDLRVRFSKLSVQNIAIQENCAEKFAWFQKKMDNQKPPLIVGSIGSYPIFEIALLPEMYPSNRYGRVQSTTKRYKKQEYHLSSEFFFNPSLNTEKMEEIVAKLLTTELIKEGLIRFHITGGDSLTLTASIYKYE